jgi:hypothetical protein
MRFDGDGAALKEKKRKFFEKKGKTRERVAEKSGNDVRTVKNGGARKERKSLRKRRKGTRRLIVE